jgi:16S rRNA (uracil1498-N3)-methyltransferase
MADRFYINCPLAPGPITLEGPEAHHLATVCRLRRGDAVCLFNGDGREYPGRIEEVGKKAVLVEILSVSAPVRELGFRLLVAVPLPRGDRAQFLVEKLTELGVTDLVPLSTARSVVHPREAKLERLQRHVIEASKQCGRNLLLQVHPLAEWDTFCQIGNPSLRLLAHPGAASDVRSLLPPREDVAVAVGPEGGFTEEEVEQAGVAGWQLIGLGPRILRVETAAVALAVLCGAVQPLDRTHLASQE